MADYHTKAKVHRPPCRPGFRRPGRRNDTYHLEFGFSSEPIENRRLNRRLEINRIIWAGREHPMRDQPNAFRLYAVGARDESRAVALNRSVDINPHMQALVLLRRRQRRQHTRIPGREDQRMRSRSTQTR